jgi:NADPH-dependent curcumin reductase CurA
MAPSSTKQWILASKPSGAPVLSGPEATFKLQTAELPAIKEGQVLARVQYFSNDTGLRNCRFRSCSCCCSRRLADAVVLVIQSTVAPERFYVPTVPVGCPMRSGVIAEVVESASPAYKAGDLVMDLFVSPFIYIHPTTVPQRSGESPRGLPVLLGQM